MRNLERFREVYRRKLVDMRSRNPIDYPRADSGPELDATVSRMIAELSSGTGGIGQAFSAACRELAIRPTPGAVQAFLLNETSY